MVAHFRIQLVPDSVADKYAGVIAFQQVGDSNLLGGSEIELNPLALKFLFKKRTDGISEMSEIVLVNDKHDPRRCGKTSNLLHHLRRKFHIDGNDLGAVLGHNSADFVDVVVVGEHAAQFGPADGVHVAKLDEGDAADGNLPVLAQLGGVVAGKRFTVLDKSDRGSLPFRLANPGVKKAGER